MLSFFPFWIIDHDEFQFPCTKKAWWQVPHSKLRNRYTEGLSRAMCSELDSAAVVESGDGYSPSRTMTAIPLEPEAPVLVAPLRSLSHRNCSRQQTFVILGDSIYGNLLYSNKRLLQENIRCGMDGIVHRKHDGNRRRNWSSKNYSIFQKGS
jgi:hypothetical protein